MSQPFTALLDDLAGGNRTVVNAVLPQVYEELRNLAHRKLRGERPDHTLNTTALVHEAYEKGKYEAAEPLLREAHMGTRLHHQGKHAEAEQLLREAMALRIETLGPEHWHVAMTRSMLGLCLTAVGRYAEAKPLLAESYTVLLDTHGPDDPRVRTAQTRLDALTSMVAVE